MTPPLHAQLPSDISRLYIPPHLTVTVVDGEELLLSYAFRGGSGEGGMVRLHDDEGVSEGNVIAINWIPVYRHLNLLPMIFFDQGRSTFPDRYQQFFSRKETITYRDNQVVDIGFGSHWEYAKYYEILNILGNRMSRFPEGGLSIEGGYTTEPGETERVGYERAQNVRHYLKDVWGIDTARIQILPPRQFSDSNANRMVMQEERRVTFHSNNGGLFSPVIYQAVALQIPLVGFLITVDPKIPADQVVEMSMIISLGDDIVSNTPLPVSSDSTISHLRGVWFLPRLPQSIKDPLDLRVMIETRDGRARISNSVRVRIDLSDVERSEEVERSHLFHFTDTEYIGLPFYTSGDTSLQPWQQLYLDSLVRSIVDDFYASYDSSDVMNISLSAATELGETPGFDPAEIDLILADQSSAGLRLEDLLKNRSLTIPLFLLPSSRRSEEESSSDVAEGILRHFFGQYFDRLEGVKGSQLKSDIIELTDSQRRGAEVVLDGRLRELKEELKRRMPAGLIDTITVSRSHRPPDSLSPRRLPEERFYSRRSLLILQWREDHLYGERWM